MLLISFAQKLPRESPLSRFLPIQVKKKHCFFLMAITAFLSLLFATALYGSPLDTCHQLAKRDDRPTLILPIHFNGDHLYLKLSKTPSFQSNHQLPNPIKLKLTSNCHISKYYNYGGDTNIAAFAQTMFTFESLAGEQFDMRSTLPPSFRFTQHQTVDGEICLKASPQYPDIIKNLLFHYSNKVVSLWFHHRPATIDGQEAVVGEMSIGEPNESRMVADSQVPFPIVSSNQQVYTNTIWRTKSSLPISVNNNLKKSCAVMMDYSFSSLALPPDLYESVILDLKSAVHSTVHKIGFPQDVRKKIMSFGEEDLLMFDCAHANRIPHIKVGQLNIPRDMLYSKNGDYCQLHFKPHNLGRGDECLLYFGYHLLSQFHLTLDFNQLNNQVIWFGSPTSSVS